MRGCSALGLTAGEIFSRLKARSPAKAKVPGAGEAHVRRRSRKSSSFAQKLSGRFRRLSSFAGLDPAASASAAAAADGGDGGASGTPATPATPASAAGLGPDFPEASPATATAPAPVGLAPAAVPPRLTFTLAAAKAALRLLYFSVDYNHLVRA